MDGALCHSFVVPAPVLFPERVLLVVEEVGEFVGDDLQREVSVSEVGDAHVEHLHLVRLVP
jgi:hypothetical protein